MKSTNAPYILNYECTTNTCPSTAAPVWKRTGQLSQAIGKPQTRASESYCPDCKRPRFNSMGNPMGISGYKCLYNYICQNNHLQEVQMTFDEYEALPSSNDERKYIPCNVKYGDKDEPMCPYNAYPTFSLVSFLRLETTLP